MAFPLVAMALGTLGSLFAKKGFTALKDIVSSATDTGIEKTKEFIEDKTGIKLTDDEGNLNNLSIEQQVTIQKVITEYQIELMRIAQQSEQNRLTDVADARDLQEKNIDMVRDAYMKYEHVPFSVFITANFSQLLAVIFVLAIFAYQFYVVYAASTIHPNAYRFIDRTLGSYDSITMTLIGFYFGNMFAKRNKD